MWPSLAQGTAGEVAVEGHEDRDGAVQAGRFVVRTVVPAELVQEVGLVAPVLGRGVVRSALPGGGHLSASVASAGVPVPALVVADHGQADARAAVVGAVHFLGRVLFV